jgi:hypothetical protein
MSSRTGRLASVFLLGGAFLLGCTEATPDYCQKPSDCTGGRICDVARAVCISPDAAIGPMDGAHEPDGAVDAPNRAEVALAEVALAEVALAEVGLTIDATSEVPAAVDAPTPIDVAEVDAPVDTGAVDVMGPDLYVPDGAGTCGGNGDCADPTKPFCVDNVCVGCQGASPAACGAQVCDAVSGRCVECTSDGQCAKNLAKGFCVANVCTGCATVGATGCAARTDGKTTCVASGSAAGQCVECAGDADCKDPTKSFCVANACGGCQSAPATACSTRSAAKPVCSTSGALNGQCVECAGDADCKDPTKSFCVANACGGCQSAPATACSTRSATKPVCSTSGTLGGQCVECSADADCKDPTKSFCVANACGGCQAAQATSCATRSATKPVCSTSGTLSGQCVACQVDADCTVPAAPICTASNTCTACTTDSQCVAKLGTNPGVCMAHQDGRCATDAETIYVANLTGCAATGTTGGTSSQPLCALQTAVSLMGTNASKHLVVLRSATDVVSATSATQVSIVGQGGAIIQTGVGNAGITLSGTGNLYARDLSVVGSSNSNIGISAGAGTTLRLERVKVLGNGGGGILLGGAAFDFDDVLVSGNGTGIDGSTTWSGIYVKALPNAGSVTKLNFVSVVNNGSPGLDCTFAVPAVSGSNATVYAAGSGPGGVNIIPNCGIIACTPALAGTCGSSLTP